MSHQIRSRTLESLLLTVINLQGEDTNQVVAAVNLDPRPLQETSRKRLPLHLLEMHPKKLTKKRKAVGRAQSWELWFWQAAKCSS